MTINRRGLFGFFAAAPALVAASRAAPYAVLSSETAMAEYALPVKANAGLKKAKIILTFDDSYPSEFSERFEPNDALRRAAERYKANRAQNSVGNAQ